MSTRKTEKPPGLSIRVRRNGSSAYYWIAKRDLIKAGYTPAMVRLHGEPDVISARCFALQAEMLQWAIDKNKGPSPLYDGTFASLVKYYEMHADSPYHELRPVTARNYTRIMKALMKHKGKRRVDKTIGNDVKRWYNEMVLATSKGTAALQMRVLRAVLSFGAAQRFKDCRELREELRYVKFGAAASRKEFLVYTQVAKFRDAARALGAEVGRDLSWVSLCLTFQFELGLRRRDVVGEYVRADDRSSGIRGGRGGGYVWVDGLTWANIDKAGILTKLVSKTRDTSQKVATHAVADSPDLAAELARIPLDRRVGPIIIHDTTGKPPTDVECRRWFRMVARKAGIPDNVQMMDARAGANTEALEAGATRDEAMALLTHSERRTNEGYEREQLERARSAAAKRQAARARKNTP